MAEAIISRAAGEAESVVPVTPGYHTILVTLKDPDGALIGNYPINCKDGSSNYSYTTNAKGQTMFVCNSGAANIFVNNYNGSYRYLDFNSCWTNIDAPIGLTTKVNINLNKGSEMYEFTTNSLFELYKEKVCNLCIIGAGGGGASGGYTSSDDDDDYYYGGGGGSGYMNNYYNQNLNGQYNFIIGVGGVGGNARASSLIYGANANSGGISYIVNTNYSASGGQGGYAAYSYNVKAAAGGLGDGGKGHPIYARNNLTNGKNSPVDFAGGGGGASLTIGGSPYGGNGANLTINGNAGTRGGGGGAGGANSYSMGGKGGNGLMRIYINY